MNNSNLAHEKKAEIQPPLEEKQQFDGRNKVLGVLFMLLGCFLFTSVNALFKGCDKIYPITQVVFFRFTFTLVLMFVVMGGIKMPPSNHKKIHFLRGFAGTISLCCLFLSIQQLPFADAMVLSFTTTLFITALAGYFLGEKIGISKWLAMLIGFGGVAIIMQPTGDVFKIGAVFALISAFLEASVNVHNRYLTRIESNTAILFYYSFFAVLLTAITLPFVWVDPTLKDTLILITLGLGGGAGQYCFTHAFRLAEATLLAPMIYSMMIWSMVYSVLFFNEPITTQLIAGSALIILSGLYILLKDKKTN